jgi:hypothetical protein
MLPYLAIALSFCSLMMTLPRLLSFLGAAGGALMMNLKFTSNNKFNR